MKRNMVVPLSSPDITDLEIESVEAVLRTPSLSLGPKLPEFEQAVADYVGTRYAVAVNSGTSGLHLAVRSLGLGEGDEVITSPFSFVASANCLLYERAVPMFVDIDPQTLNIDSNKVAAAVTSKTKAVLPVDVFGLPCDMDAINTIAGERGLKVIEDSCEALGARYKGRMAGSLGDIGVFAFYPNKQITTGEGGMVCTDDDAIAKLCRSMRNQGRDEGAGWLQHARLGYNYRLSELNCALGIAQMSRIDSIVQARKQVAAWYAERLEQVGGLRTLPQEVRGSSRSWFVYVVVLGEDYSRAERDSLLDKLRAAGIECSAYFTPIHLQAHYVEMFGYQPGDFPVTESLSNRTVALPFFNTLEEETIDYVCRHLRLAMGEKQ